MSYASYNKNLYFENIISESKIIGPGPQEIVVGDEEVGFYGDVDSDELFDGEALASMIGLSEGDPTDSNIQWLKFSFNSKILYIPSRDLRTSVSWEAIYNSGAVYGTNDTGNFPINGGVMQDTTVSKNGITFKVRLSHGAINDPAQQEGSNSTIKNPSYTEGTEWRSLISEITDGSWGSYTNTGFESQSCWLTETNSDDTAQRLLAGHDQESTHYGFRDLTSTQTYRTWIPVLEIIG